MSRPDFAGLAASLVETWEMGGRDGDPLNAVVERGLRDAYAAGERAGLAAAPKPAGVPTREPPPRCQRCGAVTLWGAVLCLTCTGDAGDEANAARRARGEG